MPQFYIEIEISYKLKLCWFEIKNLRVQKISMLKLLSIICLASLPFLFNLQGDFVFDDAVAIVKNNDVTSEYWIQPFYNDFWGMNIKSNISHKSYRPLSILSFKLNYLLSGKQLIAFHFKIVNLLCHISCCILVWRSFERIMSTRCNKKSIIWNDISFLSALLYAVHPVHVEAVCGIVGRADLLAANTFFLTFLIYTKILTAPRWKYAFIFATVLMSGISMLFKENGITSLGFCIVYCFLSNVKLNYMSSTKKIIHLDYESIKTVVLLFFALMTLLCGRWIIMGGTKPQFKPIDNPAAFSENFITKVMTYNYIYFINCLLFIWPEWLCYDWSMGCIPLFKTIMDYRITFIVLMYIFMGLVLRTIIAVGNSEATKRSIMLAVLLIIIPFMPASNIFYPVGFVIAERILYIPSAGYCLLIGIGFNKLRKMKGIRSKLATAMFLLLLFTFALRSWQRSFDWQNEYNLFISGLSVCPLNAKVHYNVAKMADAKQQTDTAIDEYKQSIRLYPEYYQAMNNLANLLKNQKQFDEAEFYLNQALHHKRDFPAAWMNLGIVFAGKKQYKKSEEAYKTALQYRKKYPDCYYNLGNLFLDMNNTGDAMNNWLEAVNLDPKHVLAWTNLLALLDNTGQIDQALQVIPKALTELPDSASINFVVANIYGKINRYKDAEIHFKRAIKLFDGKVQAIHYSNLGVLYHRWKKYKLAEEMYKKALSIDSMFFSARKNLNSLYKMKY